MEVGIAVPDVTSARTLVQRLLNVFDAASGVRLGDRSYTLVGSEERKLDHAGALA